MRETRRYEIYGAYISVREAADMLGVTGEAVRQQIAKGKTMREVFAMRDISSEIEFNALCSKYRAQAHRDAETEEEDAAREICEVLNGGGIADVGQAIAAFGDLTFAKPENEEKKLPVPEVARPAEAPEAERAEVCVPDLGPSPDRIYMRLLNDTAETIYNLRESTMIDMDLFKETENLLGLINAERINIAVEKHLIDWRAVEARMK